MTNPPKFLKISGLLYMAKNIWLSLSCQKSRDFSKSFEKIEFLTSLFPSDRHMGNKLDIFEMVMVSLARGMVKNVQKSSRYDSPWAEKSEDFDFEVNFRARTSSK